MNYELTVDGIEVKLFNNVSIDNTISALSGFTINLGNPDNQKTHRFRQNSIIELKASWGNEPLESKIQGVVKNIGFTIGNRRDLIITGVDFGDYMNRKRAWDKTRQPISYVNQKASLILANLLGFTPELKLRIIKNPEEPRMSFTTDPSAGFVLDEFKSVAEYAGYEWRIVGNDVLVFNKRVLQESNSRYNLIIGSSGDFSGIAPDLPYVSLINSNISEDGGSIRNAYQVVGNDVTGYAENVTSILEFNGKFEGYYTDNRLTSIQSCRLVAKTLAELNGVPRVAISVAHRGVNALNVGDVVRVGDVNGVFEEVLTTPYLEVVKLNSTYGTTWKTTTELGSLEKRLI
ncbi:MAG: hypothetical protein JRL30_26155, partial [Deltaproteobacteria bacterium]|nr:hypothetical protein [Deltaproteobacteria bacterium]